MPIQLNSPGWRIRACRHVPRRRARLRAVDLPGLPSEFLTDRVPGCRGSRPRARARDARPGGGRPGGLDLSYDLEPGQTAVLAIRHPSGALTFHLPVQSTSRGMRGPSQVRFQVHRTAEPPRAALIGQAIKAIVIKVAQVAADKAVSFVLPRLAEALEKAVWKKRGLKEGWLKVTKDTLAAGALEPARPVSPDRSLLFIHGTFSNAASAYRALADSEFLRSRQGRLRRSHLRLRPLQPSAERRSRTPACCSRDCRSRRTTFDVVTHSRGGLVLRNLVERAKQLGDLSRRFKLGRAVLVASPNEGTPLATPKRWDETDRLDGEPARAVPGQPVHDGRGVRRQRPRLAGQSCVGRSAGSAFDGRRRRADRGDPESAGSARRRVLGAGRQLPADRRGAAAPAGRRRRSVLWHPPTTSSSRPKAGWRIDRSSTAFIPATRIGCFGPGGNLPPDSVTHVSFFSHAETVDFLVNALLGRQQPLNGVDPRKSLPDRRLLRGAAMTDARRDSGPRAAAAPAAPEARRPRRSAPRRGAAAHHRHQRRPDVRARGAAARPLSRDATDRHREAS